MVFLRLGSVSSISVIYINMRGLSFGANRQLHFGGRQSVTSNVLRKKQEKKEPVEPHTHIPRTFFVSVSLLCVFGSRQTKYSLSLSSSPPSLLIRIIFFYLSTRASSGGVRRINVMEMWRSCFSWAQRDHLWPTILKSSPLLEQDHYCQT